MFYFIEGKKEFVGNGIAVINCSGVGFRLLVSDRTVGKTAAERVMPSNCTPICMCGKTLCVYMDFIPWKNSLLLSC
jgi:hypothetical protein